MRRGLTLSLRESGWGAGSPVEKQVDRVPILGSKLEFHTFPNPKPQSKGSRHRP
jgi:hypothetical protein